MSDTREAHALFEARLAELGLAGLDEHDRARLWQSYLKQRVLSERFDRLVAPATEPALTFSAESDR